MDKDKENIMHAEEDMSAMEQLLTEALLKANSPCPNIDGEWERMKARHQRKTLVRRMVVWTAIAATFMAAVFILMPKTADDTIYTAKAEPREIKVIDDIANIPAEESSKEKSTKRTSIKTKTVVVPEGKDHQITLPDGTEVWLNANSSITYPEKFNSKERNVKLTGEAYFKVTHDSSHPFIVNAGGIETKVLGTEFNIKAYSQSTPHVTLVEGSIEVSCIADNADNSKPEEMQNRVISPGEDASIEGNQLVVNEVNVDDMICWRDGIEYFDDASLEDILIQIGSWYNMSIVCPNKEALTKRLHYIYDRRSSVDEALKSLQDLSNTKIKTEKNFIFIE